VRQLQQFAFCFTFNYQLKLHAQTEDRQTKAEQLFGLFSARNQARGESVESRWRTGGESSFQYRNRRTRGPESKGNRRTRLATDPPTVCRPSFAAHFITMPLYSNPIIKRKTLGEWAEEGEWRQDFMFAARFHFRTW